MSDSKNQIYCRAWRNLALDHIFRSFLNGKSEDSLLLFCGIGHSPDALPFLLIDQKLRDEQLTQSCTFSVWMTYWSFRLIYKHTAFNNFYETSIIHTYTGLDTIMYQYIRAQRTRFHTTDIAPPILNVFACIYTYTLHPIRIQKAEI